jgi:glycosyltransferase involved in cell wall biosynthesis
MLGAFYKKRFKYKIVAKGTSSGNLTDASKFYKTLSLFRPIAQSLNLRNKVYHSIDRIVCISNLMVSEFITAGVDKTKLRYIPNGIPNETLIKQEATDRNSIKIVSTMRMVPVKNPVLHVKAVIHLITNNPSLKIEYSIYGGGEMQKECQTLINESQCESSIHLHGSVPHSELIKQLSDADIFLNVSLSEGLSNAILEAMINKLPIIISDVGGSRDLIGEQMANGEQHMNWKQFDHGLLTEKMISPEELSQAIRFLITNEKYRLEAGEKAVQYINEHFIMEKVIAQYDNLYKELLSK